MGSDGQFDHVEPVNVAVRDNADPRVVDIALRAIIPYCLPAGSDIAAEKLAELRMLTKARAEHDIDEEAMAAAYAARLADFPADVVVAAVDKWARRETFWPAWAELRGECDKLMRGRSQIRTALERALSQPGGPQHGERQEASSAQSAARR